MPTHSGLDAGPRANPEDGPVEYQVIARQLKTVLLEKDARIERLELENRRLLARIDELMKATVAVKPIPARPVVAQAAAPAAAAPIALAAAEPEKNMLFSSEFVRLAGPFRGVHSDHWAEPKVQISAISARRLTQVRLEVWFPPSTSDQVANMVVTINGEARLKVEPKIGGLSRLAVPLNATPHTVFEIEISCDYRCRVEPPDTRTLSYVLRSLQFE